MGRIKTRFCRAFRHAEGVRHARVLNLREVEKTVFSVKKMKALGFGLLSVAALSLTAGCGGSDQPAQGGVRATPVKAVKVLQQDAPLSYEYAGQVQAKNEIKIQARVSGNLVEKMVSGGDIVHKGQPLFRVDSRQYESAVLSAQANLAQAEATLSNSRLDTQRYRELLQSDAIAEQQVTTQESVERQNEAVVNSNRALLKRAQDDLSDTLIVSPVDGRMDVNDISVGTYVQAGQTTLASVASTDPIFVQFSVSENEYLRLAQQHQNGMVEEWGSNVSITLSDGSQYPIRGHVEQVDRGLANNSGTLTFKASFKNPDKILIPGMFARVKIDGEMVRGAVLIPQRAVQQLLEKNFVTVVNAEGKAETRSITLGDKVGGFWIVKEGLQADEVVVVEGLTKLQNGAPLEVTLTSPEELQVSLES